MRRCRPKGLRGGHAGRHQVRAAGHSIRPQPLASPSAHCENSGTYLLERKAKQKSLSISKPFLSSHFLQTAFPTPTPTPAAGVTRVQARAGRPPSQVLGREEDEGLLHPGSTQGSNWLKSSECGPRDSGRSPPFQTSDPILNHPPQRPRHQLQKAGTRQAPLGRCAGRHQRPLQQ